MIEIGDVEERGPTGRYQARGILGHTPQFHISSRDFSLYLSNTQ